MRIVLSILLGLSVVLLNYGCAVSKPIATQPATDSVFGYEIVIRFINYGNAMSKVMDVFPKKGLLITKVEQTYLSTERQEIIIVIKNGNNRQFSDVEYQLREVLSIESFLIKKLF